MVITNNTLSPLIFHSLLVHQKWPKIPYTSSHNGHHSQPRNHLPRDTAMALMDHMKSNDAERRQAQRYAQELQLGETPTSNDKKEAPWWLFRVDLLGMTSYPVL